MLVTTDTFVTLVLEWSFVRILASLSGLMPDRQTEDSKSPAKEREKTGGVGSSTAAPTRVIQQARATPAAPLSEEPAASVAVAPATEPPAGPDKGCPTDETDAPGATCDSSSLAIRQRKQVHCPVLAEVEVRQLQQQQQLEDEAHSDEDYLPAGRGRQQSGKKRGRPPTTQN